MGRQPAPEPLSAADRKLDRTIAADDAWSAAVCSGMGCRVAPIFSITYAGQRVYACSDDLAWVHRHRVPEGAPAYVTRSTRPR